MKYKIPYISNEIYIEEGDYFSAIIGGEVSKGARSPLLWNKAYKGLKIKSRMFAFDVNNENISRLLEYLQDNKFYLGGAVAVPHKKNVFNYLDKNNSKECKLIQSVNCISRNSKGMLFGNNTDGLGANLSIKNNFKEIGNESKVCVLGDGGAGVAVAVYLANLVGKKNLTICSRSENGKKLSNEIGCNWINFSQINEIFEFQDLIVNCTILGYSNYSEKSPISKDLFNLAKKDLKIFDIIYDPIASTLIQDANNNGFKTLNGMEMNLLQAVAAFSIVNNVNDIDLIKKLMV